MSGQSLRNPPRRRRGCLTDLAFLAALALLCTGIYLAVGTWRGWW